jgi:hypothetical protein
VLHLREQLSRLDEYMQAHESDVEDYNNHVKTLVTGLNARGERTLDLLSNLFKGYMAVSDTAFVEFIKRKKDAYEEGEIDLTPNELMQSTDNKYNGLKQQGRWNASSEQDEKIIALQAKIQALEETRKQPKNAIKTNNSPARVRSFPDWVYKGPKAGESEIKDIDNKTYYWCNNHRKWSLNPKHTTTQCRGYGVKDIANHNAKTNKSTSTTINASDTSTIGTAPSLQLVGALAALRPDDKDEDE